MPRDNVTENYDRVNAFLDRLVSSDHLAGANILIHRSGKEVFYHQAGLSDKISGKPISRDTIFRLFSMTKPVVAAAVMTLVDDGVISLEDAIADYIPEFAGVGVYVGQVGDVIQTTSANPITVKHLLTHTAGLSYWFQLGNPVGALYGADASINRDHWVYDPAFGGLDGLARSLGRMPLMAQPGDQWHYSMSFEVAGILIERASGEKLDTFMNRKIFEPLGMKDTGFSVRAGQADRLASLYGPKAEGGIELIESGSESPLLRPVQGFLGGGGLVSTIDDYGRFAEMLLGLGELDGRRILSAESARAMMTNQIDPKQLAELPILAPWGLGGAGDGLGFGFGGSVVINPPANGVPAFPGEYSWGGGTSTTFWVDPLNQVTVVFLTQRFPPGAGVPRDQVHSAVYEALGLAAGGGTEIA